SRIPAKGWESAGPRRHSTARLPPLSPRRSLNQFSEPQKFGVRVASELLRGRLAAVARPVPEVQPAGLPLVLLPGISACRMRAPPGAGWSSLAARRAHNPKVAGSNPAPATIFV